MKVRQTLLISVIALSTVAFGQEANEHAAQAAAQPAAGKSTNPVEQTDAQRSFAILKTLAGEWTGPVKVEPPMPGMKGDPIRPLHVTMRVTSRGNAIVHEFQEANTPLDPSKYDHPVTMIYLDSARLNLVHYCDAGNRPHMVARSSADGKTVEFDFTDISGSKSHGYMYHAIFNIIDADHHTEDWTFMLPGDKPIHAHFDLQRQD